MDSTLLGRRSAALGSVNWAFVVTLFLLLGFIFMWFQAADERDKALAEKKRAEDAYREGNTQLTEAITNLEDISRVLGFQTKNLTLGGRAVVVSDVEQARLNLEKGGEVDVLAADGSKAKVPGFVNALWNQTTLTIDQAARSGSNQATSEKTVDLSQASPKFREKLKELSGLAQAVPPKPAAPVDPGDQAAEAKYKSDLAAYEQAVAAYKNAQTSFHENGEFAAERKAFQRVVGATVRSDPDTFKAVELSFKPKLDQPITTYEQAMPLWSEVWAGILAEFKANKAADRQAIEKLQADVKAERSTVEQQNKRYGELETVSRGEIEAKTRELETVSKRAADNEQAARRAENELQVQITERKKEVSTLTAELGAYKARTAADKEQRDLEIRRDEVDGLVMAIDQQLQTGTINLGSEDKVYAGLKFVVSFVDRGGARQPKGEVQVIEVTGRKSAKVRILNASRQMGSGDLISNPFYNASRAVHVYCVGWTPDFIARRRLEQMNCVIDTAPTAKTDYFVVPDEWQGGSAAPAEGEEAAAEGQSPMDKARQESQVFGAKLITRRMLENFLKL